MDFLEICDVGPIGDKNEAEVVPLSLIFWVDVDSLNIFN